MVLVHMKAITTQTQRIVEMYRATAQERPLFTGETPEVEDDPLLSEESP